MLKSEAQWVELLKQVCLFWIRRLISIMIIMCLANPEVTNSELSQTSRFNFLVEYLIESFSYFLALLTVIELATDI